MISSNLFWMSEGDGGMGSTVSACVLTGTSQFHPNSYLCFHG